MSSVTWKPTVQMAEYMKLRLCTLDTLEQNVWLLHVPLKFRVYYLTDFEYYFVIGSFASNHI